MGLTAIEYRDLVAPLQCVANLKGAGESGAAKNKNPQGLCFLGVCSRGNSQTHCSSGRSRDPDEISARSRCHATGIMVGVVVKGNLPIRIDARRLTAMNGPVGTLDRAIAVVLIGFLFAGCCCADRRQPVTSSATSA